MPAAPTSKKRAAARRGARGSPGGAPRSGRSDTLRPDAPPATKSISAISPSWDSGGQQAAVWLETRLPSPKTTGLPWIQRIGCTTWTCWPTIALIAGERVRRSASAPGLGVTAVANSVPQWRLTITCGAPRRARARRAGSARARPVVAPGVRDVLAVRDSGKGEEGHLHALHFEDRFRRRSRSRSAVPACRARLGGARAAWCRSRTARRRASDSTRCCRRPSRSPRPRGRGPAGSEARIAAHRPGTSGVSTWHRARSAPAIRGRIDANIGPNA